MRACVFVDGENFRHSITELFPTFQQEQYLPRTADWTALFDWIVAESIHDGERIRTYWYVIKTIDYYPFRFPRAESPSNPETPNVELQRLLSKHQPYAEELQALNPSDVVTRMKAIVEELVSRKREIQQRFDSWTAIQDGIASRHNAIEFRRAGSLTCNLFDKSFSREKAVDVKLACDTIILEDIYDVGIIVSGDQDYVPAVEIIKDFGKRTVNIAFLTRSGKLLPGGARRLNQVTDWSCSIPYENLSQYIGIQ